MYERAYSGNLIIACEGPDEPEKAVGFGEISSRSGARLDYVRADAELVFQKWSRDNAIPKEASVKLENPSIADVEKAIADVSHALSCFPQEATGIDIYFAGHGRLSDGAWVLTDGAFTAENLCATMEKNLKNGAGLRGVSIMMDSCYSGAFLIELLIQNQKSLNLDFRDGLFSSLPNEKSWEMSFLGHGAFTFTRMHPGNGYVNSNELTKAIEQNDFKVISKSIQGAIDSLSNATAFLTQGRQHPISVDKGHYLNIRGYGSYSIFEESMDETINPSEIAIALRHLVENYR